MSKLQESLFKINRDFEMLAPFVARKATAALAECEYAGYPVRVFEGWRSPFRQQELYKQGRSAPGEIVTRAKPWLSTHQYGVGIDVVFYIQNKWSWEGPYDKVAMIFQANGFEWPNKSEKCHFQITSGLPVATLKNQYDLIGLQGLWMMIEERVKTMTPKKFI